VLYMPMGVLLWLRYGDGIAARAFVLAASLSLAVEVARYLRPGMEGDINAVVVAGLASVLAVRLMPAVWSMMRALAQAQPVRRWTKRGVATDNPVPGQVLGEIEDF